MSAEQIPPSPLSVVAGAALHELFSTLCEAGFTETQALRLLGYQLAYGADRPPPDTPGPGAGVTTLRVTSKDQDATVELDGRDISKALRGLQVRMEAAKLPEVVLDVAYHVNPALELEDVKVHLLDETRDVLLQLGWTPPGA